MTDCVVDDVVFFETKLEVMTYIRRMVSRIIHARLEAAGQSVESLVDGHLSIGFFASATMEEWDYANKAMNHETMVKMSLASFLELTATPYGYIVNEIFKGTWSLSFMVDGEILPDTHDLNFCLVSFNGGNYLVDSFWRCTSDNDARFPADAPDMANWNNKLHDEEWH
jgi:hypothetical protein